MVAGALGAHTRVGGHKQCWWGFGSLSSGPSVLCTFYLCGEEN